MYFETGSMTGILEKGGMGDLKKRRRDSRMILLYKGLKGAARCPYPLPLHPQLGAIKMIAHRLFRSPLQELIFTKAHFSLKQAESGMISRFDYFLC